MMISKRAFKVSAHLLALLVSMWAYWGFTYNNATGSFVALGTLAYVALFNLRRREILPSIVILMAFFAVLMLSVQAIYRNFGFGINGITAAFTVETLLYLAGSFILFKWHCSPTLLNLVRADVYRNGIPQALGMSMVLFLSAIPVLVAVVELLTHRFWPEFFTGVPFFYRNYGAFKNISFTLIMLGVWSMMLDAHYLKERLAKKLAV